MWKPTQQVPLYVTASLITSCVAMLFGLDTGIIGPVTTMVEFRRTFGELSATLHGLVVSSILLPGALTALIAGVLADRFGRTRVVGAGALTYGVGAAVECGAPVLGVFILGRVVKGAGEGLFLSTCYVQVAEISPARVRGVLAALPQFLITLGIVTGFFTCYGSAATIEGSEWAFRLPLLLCALLGVLFSALMMLVPPSPRWLIARGRHEEARAVVATLGLDEAEREEMLAQSTSSSDSGAVVAVSPPADERRQPVPPAGGGTLPLPPQSLGASLRLTLSGFIEAFSRPFRARTAFGCFIMGFQQFSGIDGVLYYAPTLFRQAGLSSEQATFLASGVSALTIVAATVPATIFADRWGRRTASLIGGTLITIEMLVMGSLYAANQVHPNDGAGRWVVIVTIYLFAITFNMTWAIAFRTFLVESLPRKTRSSGSALAQSSNWVANYLVALTTPILIAKSTFGAYYFFGFSTLFCTVVCALFMFETKGQSLEVIEAKYLENLENRRARSTGVFSLDKLKIGRHRVHVTPTEC